MNTAPTLAQMTHTITATNIAKGWRAPDGGSDGRTFGDHIALWHSEASEALDAYRAHGLDDATERKDMSEHPLGIPAKPEGVGSELADVVIRLLDTCDLYGIPAYDMDMALADIAPLPAPPGVESFGDHIAWLHFRIAACGFLLHEVPALAYRNAAPHVLRAVVAIAEKHDIDLTAECLRKMTYNDTRPYRHGGRLL